MESEMLSYIFKDASNFLQRVITVYMDESFGRDNIIKFLKLLNVAAPFLILNDYRIAKGSNALRRVELL